MRLLLDLQAAQGGSASRGVEPDALSFARAVAGIGRHDVSVLLSGLLRGPSDQLRDELATFLPPNRILTFQAPGPVAESSPGNRARMRVAELLREEFMAGHKPDLVHAGPVFGGWQDDSVVSINRLLCRAATAATLDSTDLLLDNGGGKRDSAEQRHRLRRVEELKRADLILVRSEAARQLVPTLLSIEPEKVVVVRRGVSSAFQGGGDVSASQPPGILSVVQSGSDAAADALLRGYALLPQSVRKAFPLGLVCLSDPSGPDRLRAAAASHGISGNELTVHGPMTDNDLARLFRGCAVCVALPEQDAALRNAMACGAPVLAAEGPAARDLLGDTGLLFDPAEPRDLAGKLQALLASPETRNAARQKVLGKASRLGWDGAAREAVQAFEELHARRSATVRLPVGAVRRRTRLALIGTVPQPPHGTELLSQLLRHYDVECVVLDPAGTSDWVKANLVLRDLDWFERNSDGYGRILYSLVGLPSERPLVGLLQRIPGTVLLQEYRLGGIFASERDTGHRVAGPSRGLLLRELLQTHGLPGVVVLQTAGPLAAAQRFACNGFVFRNACGVILFSAHVAAQAEAQFGPGVADSMAVVPPVRVHRTPDRAAARSRLGVPAEGLVVYSHGRTAEQQQSLLRAWQESALNGQADATLVFSWSGTELGRATMRQAIRNGSGAARVLLLDGTSHQPPPDCLAAADLVVQVSEPDQADHTAILDALMAGLPVITDLDPAVPGISGDVLYVLPHGADVNTLAAALEKLGNDPEARQRLGRRARGVTLERLHPARAGAALRDVIEALGLSSPQARQQQAVQAIAELAEALPENGAEYGRVAAALAQNAPQAGLPQLLLDVSALTDAAADPSCRRMIRAVLEMVVRFPPPGYRVDAVRLDGGRVRYARRAAEAALGFLLDQLPDAEVAFAAGDVFLSLDGILSRLGPARDTLRNLQQAGGRVVLGVSDLPPLPERGRTPATGVAAMVDGLAAAFALADQFVCVSHGVADRLRRLAIEHHVVPGPIGVGAFPMTSDAAVRPHTMNRGAQSPGLLSALRRRPTFMVTTTTCGPDLPAVMQAFHTLWREEVDVGLVVIDPPGSGVWLGDDGDAHEAARASAEFGKRLFWVQDRDDDLTPQLFGASAALLVPSANASSWPVLEAVSCGLPVMVRDVAPLRELAGPGAFPWSGDGPSAISAAVRSWLERDRDGPASDRPAALPGLKDAAATLLRVVLPRSAPAAPD